MDAVQLDTTGRLHVDGLDLAELLDADRVLDHRVVPVAYDLQTITTGGRWWVSGHLERAGRVEEFRLVAKLVHAADRSPVWPFVPPEGRSPMLELLDWRIEPAAYASGLAAVLPPDLAMPRCYAVRPVDDGSAVVWLEAVAHAERAWTDADLVRAARALGRLAGSPAVAGVADRVGHPCGPRQARAYWEGRLSKQFGAAYRDPTSWSHPVLAAEVDPATRERLLRLVEAAPALVAEIEALPLLSAHGDACANNLLLTDDAVVAIDWAFFCRTRLGFDLSQLVVSDVELGRVPAASVPDRQALVVPAYAAGLADVGVEVDRDALLRAHRVQAALASGVPVIPLERLDDDPSVLVPELQERLVLLDHLLGPLGL